MKWSSEQQQIAIALRRQGKTYRQIGAVLGRSDQQVARFFMRRDERAAAFIYKAPVASSLMRVDHQLPVPQDVLFDRDRRLQAWHLQPAAARLCGDPAPGYRERLAELEQQRIARLCAERARRWASIVAVLAIALFGAAFAAPAHAGFASEYGRGAVVTRADTRGYAYRSAPPIAVARREAVARYAGNLPEPCRRAAALGGPCGCWASIHFFGESVRRLWPVSQWIAEFTRTTPRAGVAAIWPGRHVAPVLAVNDDGTVTVADSWATHRVRMAGLIFVDPHSARRPRYARRADFGI